MVTQNPGWSRIHGNTCLHDLQSRKRECLTQEIQCFCLEVVHITAAGSTRNLPSYSVLGKRSIEYLGRATVMAIGHLSEDNNVRNKKSSGRLSARVTQTLHPTDPSRSTSTATGPTQREWKHLCDQNPPTHHRSSPAFFFFFLSAVSYEDSHCFIVPEFSPHSEREKKLWSWWDLRFSLHRFHLEGPVSHLALWLAGPLVCGQQRRHSRRWFWGIWVTWYI